MSFINVKIDDKMKKEVKIKVAKESITITKKMIQLIKKWLSEKE